ncbi:MAG: ATP-binding protein [Crenarchaeota archaeon]|nr:ATP-binding protein [Thermoproteota archaeon]
MIPVALKKMSVATIYDFVGMLQIQEYDIPRDLFDACRAESNAVPLGVVPLFPRSDCYAAVAWWCPRYVMNPHMAVVASTGGGKTTLLRTMIALSSILMGTVKRGAPRVSVIILDWRRDFTILPEALGIGKVYRIGSEYTINPLLGIGTDRNEVAQNFSHMLLSMGVLEERSIRGITILEKAVHQELQKYEIDRNILLAISPSLPTMSNIMDAINEVLHGLGDSATSDDKRSAEAIKRRLTNIASRLESRSSRTKVLNPLRLLLDPGIHVIDLSELPEAAKKMVMFYITYVAYQAISSQFIEATYGLDINAVLVIDEAHHILTALRNKEEADAQPLMKIIREGRQYGLAVWLSTQNPDDVPEHVLNNIGTVFIGRLGVRSKVVEHLFGREIAKLVENIEPLSFIVRVNTIETGGARVIPGNRVFKLKLVPYFPPRGSMVTLLTGRTSDAENTYKAISKKMISLVQELRRCGYVSDRGGTEYSAE